MKKSLFIILGVLFSSISFAALETTTKEFVVLEVIQTNETDSKGDRLITSIVFGSTDFTKVLEAKRPYAKDNNGPGCYGDIERLDKDTMDYTRDTSNDKHYIVWSVNGVDCYFKGTPMTMETAVTKYPIYTPDGINPPVIVPQKKQISSVTDVVSTGSVQVETDTGSTRLQKIKPMLKELSKEKLQELKTFLQEVIDYITTLL